MENRTTADIFIPKALQAMNNWTAWKLEQRKGQITKVPYSVTGRRAESNNRDTWSSFDAITELLSISDQYNGYGFMIADGVTFVDVDHCIEINGRNGTVNKTGTEILNAFPLSYAEFSQSYTGLHILTLGTIPRNFNNRKSGVEMYSSSRFCAMTGKPIQRLEPANEQDGLDWCFNKHCTRPGKTISTYSIQLPTGISTHSDRWIIAHAMNIEGQQGRNFRSLFAGDISGYPSASEADSALCTLLAFWCDRDMGQVDRIFRQSGLYRPKWERRDYREGTIIHACEYIPESLSEYQRRMCREKAIAIAEER